MMAIQDTDLKIYKSANGGLGGAIDLGAESVSGVSNNLFNTFSGAETQAGGTFYCCLYIKNEHASLTAQAVEFFINSETVHAGMNVSLAVGAAAVNASESAIGDENTAPAGVTFSDTDTTSSGAATEDVHVSIPDIPNGQAQAVWVRVIIDAATLAVTDYAANTKIEFDTEA